MLFIFGVLVKTIFQGVSLPERRMIKWSGVESIPYAVRRMMPYLYPILSNGQALTLTGESRFKNELYVALKKESELKGIKTQLEMPSESAINLDQNKKKDLLNFKQQLRVITVPDVTHKEKCTQKIVWACVAEKAWQKLKEKKKSKHSLWISMYRLSKSEIVLLVNSEQ